MGLNILYLEDNSVFAEQARRLFLAGHQVTIVPTLAAARKATEAGAFDLLLADYDLDDGKGHAFVGEYRRRNPKTPIVAVSSHAEGNAALMAAGATVVCGKLQFDKIGEVLAGLGRLIVAKKIKDSP